MPKRISFFTVLFLAGMISSNFVFAQKNNLENTQNFAFKTEILSKADIVLLAVDTTSGATSSPPKTPSNKTILLKIDYKYMYLDGVKKEVDPGKDTAPIITEGRTLIPIRSIIEALGGTIVWNDAEKKVSLVLKDKNVNLWINNVNGSVNGQTKKLDVAPKIINGRTMLPLRFVTENLGCQVVWDGAQKIITITY